MTIIKDINWRFISKINIVENNECWIWQAGKDKQGYGRYYDGINDILSHRFAWELVNGPIPTNLCVCHRCDNPSCCNPTHMFLGTIADNNKDRTNKGRTKNNNLNGESSHLSKLSEEQINQIKTNIGTLKDIARQFGISFQHVSRIKNKKTWKHL